MEYSFSYTDTSSTSINSSAQYDQQERESCKPFRSALHSVRKFPAKSIITKKPIAPLPPTPARVYKVSATEFKDVVQQLTGASEFMPTRLQEVAPPPLSLSLPSSDVMPLSETGFFTENYQEEKTRRSFDQTFGGLSPLGFSMSPSSLAWCSAMLLSPKTLASFEPSVVL